MSQTALQADGVEERPKAKPDSTAAVQPVRKRPAGRPSRYAEFEDFEAKLAAPMNRPKYRQGIGIFKGAKETTAFVKITLQHGGMYNGRSVKPGGAVEHKLGKRSSFDWPELLAERDRLQKLADHGEPLEAVEVETFAKYALDWLERRKPTLRSYGVTKGNVHSALIPTFGKKALNAITVADVNRWIGKQSVSLKPATVQRQLNVFNAVMNDAVRAGIIERNPSERADKIRGIEPRQRFVTEDEWKAILDAADNIEEEQDKDKETKPHQIRGWLCHYVDWAYNSGMRRAEILNLTWDEVRKVDDEVTVVLVGNTKTGKPRSVTCTEAMKGILTALQGLERVEGDNRLFPISMTTLKRALTRLWRKTGLRDVRLHDLRRSHATILVNRGVDVRTVAARLGHSGTAMLSKHYAVNLGDMHAAKAFDAAAKAPADPTVRPADG
jgi:integrase